MSDTREARLRLLRSANVGPVTYAQLLARFGTAEAALDALPTLAARGGGRAPQLADAGKVRREIAAVERLGARYVFLDDPDYPALLGQIESGRPLSQTYPYPVSVWRIGNDLKFVALGGEVVVDYALRIKADLDGPTWIAGYAHDVMAYIPSRRVLTEGGYEGGGAMVYYGLPCPWAPEVEEVLMGQVVKLAKESGR